MTDRYATFGGIPEMHGVFWGMLLCSCTCVTVLAIYYIPVRALIDVLVQGIVYEPVVMHVQMP